MAYLVILLLKRISYSFYVESNDIASKDYLVEIIKTPTIQNISVALKYPKYLQ